MRRSFACLVVALLVAGCAAPPADATGEGVENPGITGTRTLATQQAERAPTLEEFAPAAFRLPAPPLLPRAKPAIVRTGRPLQCVPYARKLSGINLRGDAWTWWQKANGRYVKGHMPSPGAVLVFSKTRRLRLGHLAVVVEVRNSREIVVHQANWLNAGRIHRYTPVRDVSKDNDWSVVRVWYTPGQKYGSGYYPAYGFIYPNPDDGPDLRQAANE